MTLLRGLQGTTVNNCMLQYIEVIMESVYKHVESRVFGDLSNHTH